VYFGTDASRCAILGQNVVLGETVEFEAVSGGSNIPVHLNLEGGHYVSDALAAVSVGLAMGISPEKITQALASFRNMEGRQEILAVKGYTIIKDCYNAGPESMAAALNVLGNRPGRKIAVLGDMLELGPCAPAEHYKIGSVAAQKADLVLAYGPNGGEVVKGALSGGMREEQAKAFLDRGELVAALRKIACQGDVMLFKGSHGMHMELALEQFLRDE
jgi:UDP-N-acetylmuramyl pentapeptide synthase